MDHKTLLLAYKDALATQRWDEVAPLIHEDACFIFSEGTYLGKAAIEPAVSNLRFDKERALRYQRCRLDLCPRGQRCLHVWLRVVWIDRGPTGIGNGARYHGRCTGRRTMANHSRAPWTVCNLVALNRGNPGTTARNPTIGPSTESHRGTGIGRIGHLDRPRKAARPRSISP
jgi:hypothetical protein